MVAADADGSSDEEEFYDADEELIDLDKTEVAIPDGPMRDMSFEKADNFDFGDSHEDFDEIYNNAEEHDVGNVQQEHGSVLVHLLSQVSIGMDLTKVTLPTFILERRSLLEMYADFFAHPDAFVATVELETPQERFISVVRYYLNAFYAARKSGVAKKPYNPILGETFRCRYKLPEENSSYNLPDASPSGERTDSGPFPGSDINQLTFIAEQVSHHPPVSAFYAEHPAKRISFNAHIYTKSSFLGLSIGVANIGSGTVILHDFDERYTVTFPSGYGRSIMSTPWVELGGKVKIVCEKTGFYADIDFLTKPFFGGKPHRIQGSLYKEGSKKPFMTIRGEWNNVMMAKPAWGDEYLFIDVKAQPEMKKECVPVVAPRDGRIAAKSYQYRYDRKANDRTAATSRSENASGKRRTLEDTLLHALFVSILLVNVFYVQLDVLDWVSRRDPL
ncbi:Oxysterol-binding protein [Teladorsagia circumcincta]|uniref:Oxysterol-binding protein n=1 Tax=Teladorsagia circumcincta TaxID=45464 RepID=A0A2G9TSV6_TELCI|nr:Oxysterol-binding protein [Teladorsagia circumcincta]